MQQHAGHGEIVVKLRLAVFVEHGLAGGCVDLQRMMPFPGGSALTTTRACGGIAGCVGSAMAIKPGRMTRKGNSILGNAPMSGVRLAALMDFCSHGALHDEKIRTPVAEGEHEAQAHHQAEPFDPEAVGVRVAQSCPRVRVTWAKRGFQSRPAADIFNPK